MTLTIITINRNNADGLKKTLKSVASQICKNYEHIIIDGASTDESVQIIKDYVASDAGKNVSYWVSENDTGVYNAMNKGIKHAKGEYCLFLNSGDWLKDENVIQYVSNANFKEDIVYFDALCVFNDKTILRKMPEELTISYFLFGGTINHQNELIKTILLNQNPYNEKNRIISDTEFNIKMVCQSNISIKYEKTSISYYESEAGISSKSQKLLQEEYKQILCDIFDSSVVESYKLLNDYQNGYGGILRMLRNILKPIREFILKILGKRID